MKFMKLMPRIMTDRIFIAALLLSAAWHIFWLSSVKVVMVPEKSEVVRFSKVLSLGPILEKGALEVRMDVGQRPFLPARGRFIEAPDEGYLHALSDKKLSGYIIDAVDNPKIEPSYGI